MIPPDDTDQALKNVSLSLLLRDIGGLEFGIQKSQLNGEYTAQELRRIANAMDEARWTTEPIK